MIDAVSTLSVQSTALRGNPQNGTSFLSAGGAGGADVYANMPKLGTRLYVRIDSAAERAILEVRASDTGEVVNQYPSEAQIKAFQRAERLATTRAEQEASRAINEAARNVEPVQQQTQQTRDIQTPEPIQIQQTAPSTSSVIAPTPQKVSAPAPADTSVSTGGGESGSSQSVVV